MYLVYFIKCEQDFHRMIALHPDITIFGTFDAPTFEQFTSGYKLPMAGFVYTPTNKLVSCETADAKRRLRERPGYYTKVDLPKTLSHVHVLRKFLKANRAYSKFKRNFVEATNTDNSDIISVTTSDTTDETTRLIDALTQCSFSWYSTPEGRNYWSNLAHKWHALVRHFKLDKEVIGNYHDKL